ncbi:hypothetical protein TNIN_259621 [Trichonephila inaurata madagascariensis]|uniref:Uncharacterized protein n=1 Tax=Trichonephila inaurata madagascariensis TaxID=2747483 RepID=A0A8X6Y0V6_9ARAC|nr:hypothetical protein TNIN_259621 [Trichonephila inaurata madagascariensis]
MEKMECPFMKDGRYFNGIEWGSEYPYKRSRILLVEWKEKTNRNYGHLEMERGDTLNVMKSGSRMCWIHTEELSLDAKKL